MPARTHTHACTNKRPHTPTHARTHARKLEKRLLRRYVPQVDRQLSEKQSTEINNNSTDLVSVFLSTCAGLLRVRAWTLTFNIAATSSEDLPAIARVAIVPALLSAGAGSSPKLLQTWFVAALRRVRPNRPAKRLDCRARKHLALTASARQRAKTSQESAPTIASVSKITCRQRRQRAGYAQMLQRTGYVSPAAGGFAPALAHCSDPQHPTDSGSLKTTDTSTCLEV